MYSQTAAERNILCVLLAVRFWRLRENCGKQCRNIPRCAQAATLIFFWCDKAILSNLKTRSIHCNIVSVVGGFIHVLNSKSFAKRVKLALK